LNETEGRQPAALPSIRRRLAAIVYEAFLLLGVLAVGFMIPQVALGLVAGIALPGAVLFLHIFLLLGVYFILYWRRGATLAMQTWKLEVRSAAGGRPSWRQLALRYLAAWPGILLGGAGLLWALVDRDRQFLHDRLAGTRIVFRSPSERKIL
jgi:uncharacterized RDD family membrane protein YckC